MANKKYSREILKALDQSIEDWKIRETGAHVPRFCPLCVACTDERHRRDCDLCPANSCLVIWKKYHDAVTSNNGFELHRQTANMLEYLIKCRQSIRKARRNGK